MSDPLERGREQFHRRRWGRAYAELTVADELAPLSVDDVERLAVAAYLVGRHTESIDAWARAHHLSLEAGDPARAVRSAYWLWFGHMQRGEMAQAGGWLGTAKTVLTACTVEGACHGYARAPEAVMAMFEGDLAGAYDGFCELVAIGDRYGDLDLQTLGRLGQGQCLVFLGKVADGISLLDEAMVSATTGGVSPAVVGLAYCAVIDTCRGVFDIRRAHEWTVALSRWCDAQPDLEPYRGQCLVHRAELMQLRGAWPDALAEAKRAEELLGRPPPDPGVGAACYQQAELHRLRGEVTDAEEAYRQAAHWGHQVQPGLSLLRLAQGQVSAAMSSVAVAVEEGGDPGARCMLLAAATEVMLAAGDVEGGRRTADELRALASGFDAPLLAAMAATVEGAVLLAEGDPRGALSALRRAWMGWRDLDAPYEGARARVLIGLAYRQLGDDDSAAMELDAARWVFQDLGATPDVARVDGLTGSAPDGGAGALDGHHLTGREVEILRYLASGRTNKAIAAELVISEKTVARHVANIFTKLGLSSRAGATAYAYEHGLV
jgi:DNA-binding CsgD family transcriptional regulator